MKLCKQKKKNEKKEKKEIFVFGQIEKWKFLAILLFVGYNMDIQSSTMTHSDWRDIGVIHAARLRLETTKKEIELSHMLRSRLLHARTQAQLRLHIWM